MIVDASALVAMAFALAKESGLPLLFKGNDFPKTDIEPALKD